MIGLSTGDGPTTTVPSTSVPHDPSNVQYHSSPVDLTVQELANTDGTTENVENLQSRMENQYEDNQYPQQYDQPIHDDHGIALGMIMVRAKKSPRTSNSYNNY